MSTIQTRTNDHQVKAAGTNPADGAAITATNAKLQCVSALYSKALNIVNTLIRHATQYKRFEILNFLSSFKCMLHLGDVTH